MPNAVTHVLTTIILIDIFRDFIIKNKKKIPMYFVFIGGIAGLLPDIDVPIGWVLAKFGINVVHGWFTHTLFFAFVFLAIALIYYRINKKASTLFMIIFFGVMWHIFLDFLLGGGFSEGVMFLYPFSYSPYKLHLLINTNLPNIISGLDAVILLAWLYYLQKKHKIKDFI